MLNIDLLLLVSHTTYNGLQIFAELDFPVLNADRERWIFLQPLAGAKHRRNSFTNETDNFQTICKTEANVLFGQQS